MTNRLKRILFTSVAFPVGIVVGILIIFYSILALSLPQRGGSVTISGPQNPTEITLDSMGVPQIWAESDHDGYFAFGFIHAGDRLFQMELIRRISQGRISELLGEITLSEDIRQRRAGHYRMATEAEKTLSPENRLRLIAYVDGINAYLDECSALPIEFYLLQSKPERWTIIDCLSILSFQTWFSDALLNRDLFFLKMEEELGREKASSFTADYPDWAPTTITRRNRSQKEFDVKQINESKYSQTTNSFRKAIAEQLFSGNRTPFLLTESSNAWVVAPSRSNSGRAMLASDPHLDISRLPGFWYLSGLRIKESGTNMIGISTPGLPMMVMGHNGKSAFAFTAGGIDITEYYREEYNPNDSTQYLTIDGSKDFVTYVETLYVAGTDEPIIEQFRWTERGPIVYENDSLATMYSLRWAGFDADLNHAIQSGFDLHNATTVEQFRTSVSSLGALDANWLYSDHEGNIAYQLGTPLPIRTAGQQNFPRSGQRASQLWRGYYPLNLTPYVVNPSIGWLGNCNNRPATDSYLYQLSGNFFVDRIMRLEQLFKTGDKFGLDDMHEFQMDIDDSYLLRWKDKAIVLLSELNEPKLQEALFKWDGITSSDSKETLLLELFLNLLTRYTYEDELGDMYHKVRTIWTDQQFHGGDSSWFDDITTDDIVETKHDIALKAMTKAIELAGDDSWGERHSLTIAHPLAAVPVLNKLIDLKFGPWKWSGTAGTLNASFFSMDEDYNFKSFVGPSYRFLIDFANIDSALFVLPNGNSGNPASPYFFNFNQMWQNGERWVVPFVYDKVKAGALTSMLLLPKD